MALDLLSDRLGTPRVISVPDGLIRPTVRLLGEDGNAFSILGRVRVALKRVGNERRVLDAYTTQATSGDYDYLLAVTLRFIELPDDPLDRDDADR